MKTSLLLTLWLLVHSLVFCQTTSLKPDSLLHNGSGQITHLCFDTKYQSKLLIKELTKAKYCDSIEQGLDSVLVSQDSLIAVQQSLINSQKEQITTDKSIIDHQDELLLMRLEQNKTNIQNIKALHQSNKAYRKENKVLKISLVGLSILFGVVSVFR